MTNITEEIKQSSSYRYVKELVEAFDKSGVNGEPIEIPMHAVLLAPIPEYLSKSAAVKTKLIFLLSIYANSNRLGSLTDAISGMTVMIMSLAQEMKE